MNTNILDDLKQSALLMAPRNAMRVPLSYAKLVHAELLLRGVEINRPERGDEMALEFSSGRQITLCVH